MIDSSFTEEELENINKFKFIKLDIDKNYCLKFLPEYEDLMNALDTDFVFVHDLDENHIHKIGKSLGLVTKNFNDFNQLGMVEKDEYLNAYYSKNKELKLIKKYCKVRLGRLFENLLQYPKTSNLYKSEINLLKSLELNEPREYAEELLNTLIYFKKEKEDELIEKIKVLKFIDSLFGGGELSVILTINSKKYELKSEQILEPRTFNILSNHTTLSLRKSLEQAEILIHHNGFINKTLHQKRIIKFNISDDFDTKLKKARVHVIKEAKIVAEILEPFCQKFSFYILSSKINGTIFVGNFLMEYHRLARAYYTIKLFDRALFWIEECYDIIEKLEINQNVDFINNEFELKKLEELKSHCVKKIEHN